MKAIDEGNGFYHPTARPLVCAVIGARLLFVTRALMIAGFLFLAIGARAQIDPIEGTTNIVLESWSFYDSTGWSDDAGRPPTSFTNIAYSSLGDFQTLVVDTNVPAWLNYNIVESDGTTNLTVDSGTVTFWFAPGSWSSGNLGGTGPGEYGRLFEVGSYTPDSSYGLWSIYMDDAGNNLYFSAQTNDLSSNVTTYVTAPISWTNDFFHFVALTYCATNTALYFDGVFVTNGPGVTTYPGPEVLTNGFWIGGDATGSYQAHGLFDMVATYNYPMNSNDVWLNYQNQQSYFRINPFNIVMETSFADSSDYSTNDLLLQFGNTAGGMASLYIQVPLSTLGSNLFMLDVYATTNLSPNVPGLNATNWIYLTRSAPGQTNLIVPTLTNVPVCFYRLGTLLDTDGDGLPDAFEMLVSHTNPNSWDSDGDGISDGDEISPSGLPWKLELARKWAAIIYANSPTATQGGASGQCTVYLPTNAPTGGVTVHYSLSGSAVLNSDYTVSPTAGQLTIPAGNSSGVINLTASSGSTYSPINLYADLTLTNVPGYRLDGTPAEISIIDSGSPSIRVYAMPQWTHRPSATYGTNTPGFYFIRGGTATSGLTANLSFGGSAISGTDYSALPSSVTFAANVRTNWLPLTIIPNSTNPVDKTLTMTISSASGYLIDPTNGTATMTIAATASPVLPVVQVKATDIDVTPASPGQFTFTRSFATTNALRVYYHVWGDTNTVISSTNGQDSTLYTGLPGYVDIPANVTNATASVTASHPISTCQSVTVTLSAGDYSIGNSNMATVYVDGTGVTNVVATVARDGIYGTSSQAAEITLVRYGSALSQMTMNWSMSYSYIGNSIRSANISGDIDSGGHILWATHQSVAHVKISVTMNSNVDSWVLPTLTVSNSLGSFSLTVPYNPPSAMFQVYGFGSPATTVNKGSTAYLTVGRPHPNANAATVYLTVSGSAVNGTDYSFGTTVNFAANQYTVTVPFQAINNASQGWKTAIISMNSGGLSSQVGQVGSDRGFVRIQDLQNTLSDTDMDGDGLPDGYELNNGLDPLTPNNPYVDNDRDGLGLLEELELGTNPNAADSSPVYPSIEPSDYVAMTMRVGAIGKMLVEPDQNCAVCHAVTLRAGNFIRTSGKTDWTHNPTTTDYLVHMLRGTNYPVQVTCDPYYSSLLASNEVPANNTPHYTAAYVAQFLQDTNGGPWPFVVDTNHLLGTNLPMVQEVLPKTATLYVPDMTIAADVDRNGNIVFTNRNDRTMTTNPFVFWINDDCDSGSDDTASDLDPSQNSPDSANNAIGNLRDLEDFARLQFKIDGLPPQFLTNGNYQVKVYLTNLLGSPSLRLFPAAEASGGIGYLTNTTTATTQMAKTMLGVVTNGTPLNIASNLWQTAGANSFFLPMIFEGISTGQCVITFGFSTNNQPPVAMSRPFYLNLKHIADLYEHWTVGDNTNSDWTQIPAYPTRTADSGIYSAPQSASDLDYIVLAHGWRMQPWERRAFASTAYKRMWQLGYKGRFILYSWPTDYTGTTFWDMTSQVNRQNYDRSEQRAWKSGVGLFSLLADLNETEPPNKIRVLAHSMGNIVASEALRLAGVTGVGLPLVQGYIASQAASVAHAYDATNPAYVWYSGVLRTPELYAHFQRGTNIQPYFTGMKKAVQGANIINFNNVQDYALSSTFAWPANQDTKPDSGWYCQFVATNSVNTNTGYTFWNGNNQLILNGGEKYHDQVYEIFAHIAQAECSALGSAENPTHHVRGEIGGAVDLNAAPFNFKANTYEHSAEFNSINMNRRSYWWQILSTFSLTNGLPSP